jgi:DNA segregation ATPase FtsK/SpoIIIE, S-DNA-T family
LLSASGAAMRDVDLAVATAERELAAIEQERKELDEFLSVQSGRFGDYRSQLDRDAKLAFFASRFGSLEPDGEPVVDKGELEKTLDSLFAEAGRYAHEGRIKFFFFRKRWVSQAIGCVEQGRAIVRQSQEAAPAIFEERERKAALKLSAAVDAAKPAIDAWSEALAETAPAWDSERWSSWQPVESIPHAIPFGAEQRRSTPIGEVSASSEWVLNAGNSLFLWKHGSEVIEQVQSLVLRILAQFPPGMARFVFVDPLGAGKSVAPFLHLTDYDEGLVGGKVWSEGSHIEQRLSELQAHIEMVVQKYLRGQFSDIEAHNAAAGEIAEAYRFLVIFDFPANFSEQAARRLVSITRNGPACGVYAIVIGAPGREMPYGFDGTELDGPSTIFTRPSSTGGTLATITGSENVSPWQHRIEPPPPLVLTNPDEEKNLFTRVISGIGAQAKAATNVEVSESRLLELLETTLASGLTEHQPVVERSPRLDDEETWWTGDAAQGIAVPIGRIGARAVQSLALVGTDTSVHALVAGKTGSGKSTLLHAAILNLCLLYSPEELELYLVDFKQGVEFKPYALASLPHARVVAIESEREFGLSVLRGLEKEIAMRGERFREAGADDLHDYRRVSGKTMPRILLVADEFHVLFSDDDALANEAARILDALVRQGRSFGVHVILASQTISGVHQVGRGTMNQIAVRIALQCTESDSQVIFGEDNADARTLSRPGEAIYNSMNGLPEGNRRFQVVMLHDEEREQLLKRIGALAEKRGMTRSPIVFEGNAQADLTENDELGALLRGEGEQGQGPTPLRTWLGAPISLDGPVAVRFDRRAGANLLFTGSDSEVVDGALTSSVTGLLPQVAAASGSIDVLDFGGLDERFALVANELAGLAGSALRIGRRRQLGDVLGKLREELERRIESPALPGPPLLLVLHRLQSARDFDAVAVSLDDESNPGEALAAILRDGPEFGIHTVASCDTATNLERRLEPAAQREFGLRLVTRMSENDSLQLIDVPDAAKLLGAQGIFSDEDRSERAKLRCYDFPPSSWLEGFAESPVWPAGHAAGEQPDPAVAAD